MKFALSFSAAAMLFGSIAGANTVNPDKCLLDINSTVRAEPGFAAVRSMVTSYAVAHRRGPNGPLADEPNKLVLSVTFHRTPDSRGLAQGLIHMNIKSDGGCEVENIDEVSTVDDLNK